MNFKPGILWTDVKTFFPMLWAIVRGKYKMPWSTLVWAFVCVVYLISPIDALPDVLPLLGITDDGAFVIWVLTLLHKDLVAFRQQQAAKPAVILEAEVIKAEKNNSVSKKL